MWQRRCPSCLLRIGMEYMAATEAPLCKAQPNRICSITKASAIAPQKTCSPSGPRLRSPQTSPYPPASSAPCRAFSLN